VIIYYYPEIDPQDSDRYLKFYAALIERTAKLAAQWMAAGFCHGVLNTDNMSITGESFDYGPYAFIPSYNPQFTAAYFDYGGRYSYGNQPFICRLNLELLQSPLAMVVSLLELDMALANYDQHYNFYYQTMMLKKLGFEDIFTPESALLVSKTLEVLQETGLGYHDFFYQLSEQFNYGWRENSSLILENMDLPKADWQRWRELYSLVLNQLPLDSLSQIGDTLKHYNPKTALLRPLIESVWEAITYEDDWQPFQELVIKLQNKQ
jgi:uncharacterized protein YdiU (UPF0061 family)